jgi:hypothetical protein
LEKAGVVGAAGVVVSSLHFRDYEYFRQQGGLTLLVLTKFGEEPLSAEGKEKILKMAGREAVLDGGEKKLETD